MEFLLATGLGVLTSAGVYLTLRRHTFPVIIGLTLLSYAVNVFIFVMGRLAIHQPPILDKAISNYSDPLPQALVLTAIVISFGMTALIVVLALRGFLETGSDGVEEPHVDADASIKDEREGVVR
ncbi:MAG: Na+/H+ antiporter subunit C [Beijerinckiaceae bacterium]|nr:Na+/H+ antiporter subunit C [Beijerinckiaceae bacterium]